ncbi:endonuclease domain-containing protein [Arcanobacterium ihumii]|uniref:endonuclease domain-containing protein n=1 Tax=Arcanobacterium ihumii TaxID=2138162 RepID=UPI000F524E77|nr:hypothetical protein [Arcanobacterium ihumii]
MEQQDGHGDASWCVFANFRIYIHRIAIYHQLLPTCVPLARLIDRTKENLANNTKNLCNGGMYLDSQFLGVFNRSALAQIGIINDRQLKKSISAGELNRIARNWFALKNANPRVVAAIHIGARVGCLTGCSLFGIWVPRNTGIHYVLPVSRSRPAVTYRDNACLHRVRRLIQDPIYSLDECIKQVLQFHDRETGFIILESAINQGLISLENSRRYLESQTQKKAALSKYLCATSESGSESRVRLFFLLKRTHVQSQVQIDGIGRVDILVGRSLIIECDSAAYHSEYKRYIYDRQRDLAALSLGYKVIRLSYEQIWSSWEHTQGILSKALQARIHRKFTYIRRA